VEGIEVSRALPEHEPRIAELLEINGLPRRMAAEERFLVAGWGSEVFAALEYREESGRLLLGCLVSDPLASERLLARVLYAEAHALAREMGLEEVRASPPAYADYPHEVGYRRRHGCWSLDSDTPLELRGELPESRWRRVLALWGFTAVPFFRAFSDPDRDTADYAFVRRV
jgi:hypothetical protein